MDKASDNDTPPQQDSRKAFEEAGQAPASGLVAEFWQFLRHNKKFWLLPIVIFLLFLGVLLVLGGTAVAPFIYPLF